MAPFLEDTVLGDFREKEAGSPCLGQGSVLVAAPLLLCWIVQEKISMKTGFGWVLEKKEGIQQENRH